ncbi:hypothetical protein [Siphonobacter curvatus]|uniref:Uncharacterized protein n=1 Tax=Siphonobacter curvatus TaxID=2094562 RepID=A0A2S7IJS3_9BACT|nr:hypothetical protein [Siphonobacter curvatus]PQA56910.1 hypothetical protein C5O19_16370 [Siphonobacter curvatus]
MILFTLPVVLGLSIEVYFIVFVLGVANYFFLQWLFTAVIKVDEKTRREVTWILTIASTPILYVALVLLYFQAMSYTPNLDFEAELWATQTHKRFQMAEDLIDRELLLGKDTTQVKDILGDPDRYGRCIWKKNSVNTWTYSMGSGGGSLSFLYHQLSLKFDQGRVVRAEHIEIDD